MDIKDIKTLIDLMRKNDLSTFKMEKDDFKITLKRGSDDQPVITNYVPAPAPAPGIAQPLAPLAPAAAPAAPAASDTPKEALKEITSPMVGTFYASPSPDSPAYVSVGQSLTADSVVCIIEAMKVMNEIKAEISGTVVEVCVENGKPVQFGQVLFRLK